MIDERAFVQAAQEQLDSLYRLSLSILKSPADAQDAVQQGMLRAWERRVQVQDPEKLCAWLRRIVINECRNIQRRRMRVFPADELPRTERSHPMENGQLREALDTLPEALRTPLLLKYMDGFSEKEIARVMGVPKTTVKSRLYRARRALAIALLLIALAVTALAAYVVTNGFYADVAQLHAAKGEYDSWTLAEKESLLASMMKYGILDDASAWQEALRIRSDKRREEALDALYAARYGIDGRTDVITAFGIVEKEAGLFDSEWSLEKKAEYSQMMLELDLLGYDENVALLPTQDDITQEEAAAIARSAVLEAYGLEENALEDYEVHLYFQLHRSELGVKRPYYVVEMIGPGRKPYWVYVCGDGRVLGEGDGYKGVTSPVEEAARLAAVAEKEKIPKTERFAEHVKGLELLDTQVYVRKDSIVDGAEGLADGTAVVFGRLTSGYMVYDGVFAECMDENGQTKWRLELPEENGEKFSPEAMMELDGGELLMIFKRQKPGKERQSIEYIRYDQVRIGRNGEVKERKQLKPISELAGVNGVRHEQMFAAPGHGGMLVSGYAGGKHIPVYAQLDESGEAVCTWSFEELLGYAPYLETTDEGYVLCAWNEAANMPILRFYNENGQLVREGESDPGLTGLRINQVLSCGNGELMAASNFMADGEWTLSRIGADGRLIDKQVYRDESGPILRPTGIVRVNGRYVYACDHHLSANDSTNHTGVVISDAGGAIREYSMQGADDFSDRIGYLYLAPVGEGKGLIAYTTIDWQEKVTAQLAVVSVPE